ncbi:NPCBM/NEW2 domain-containing protein [Thalassobacillus hwangdonensis]|uniref:NPCBM/NEW2 domain-containing protein n=1 Tax=Thalassobacillus hwangdonensis TaxID=546108 RepID=A0ABW3L588_9BACI
MFNFFLGYMVGSSDRGGSGDSGTGCFGLVLGVLMFTVVAYVIQALYTSYQWFNGLADNFSALSMVFFPYIIQNVLDLEGTAFGFATLVINIIGLYLILKTEKVFIKMRKNILNILAVGLLSIYLYVLFFRQAIMGVVNFIDDGHYLVVGGWILAHVFALIYVSALKDNHKEIRDKHKTHLRKFSAKLEPKKYHTYYTRFFNGEFTDNRGNTYENGHVFQVGRWMKETFKLEFPMEDYQHIFQGTLGVIKNQNTTNTEVEFEVLLDGTSIYSKKMNKDDMPVNIKLNIKGGKRITFQLRNVSSDQSHKEYLKVGLFNPEGSETLSEDELVNL